MKYYNQEVEDKINEIRNEISNQLLELLKNEKLTVENIREIIDAYEAIY